MIKAMMLAALLLLCVSGSCQEGCWDAMKLATRSSYDTTAADYKATTDCFVTEFFSQKFESLLSPGAKILDLGCGPGRDAKYFTERGYEVVGVDLSSKMIAIAQENAPKASFQVMDIEKLSFPEESFDAVWSSASLLHIPNKALPKVLDAICRCLRPEGVFYLSTIQGDGEAFGPHARYNGVEKFWAFIQEDELVNLLETHGFIVVEHGEREKIPNYTHTDAWIKAIAQKKV